jgi:hypothetical protein
MQIHDSSQAAQALHDIPESPQMEMDRQNEHPSNEAKQ